MNLSLEINLIFSISHQIYVPLISNRGCQRTLLNYIMCPAKRQSTGRFVIFGYNRVDYNQENTPQRKGLYEGDSRN